MLDIKPSILLEDSKGNRYLFYYRDSSIYCREVSGNGDIKDTMLASQANGDYAAAIDTDDNIYLTCNSRYKGILLFIYSNNSWKFEPVVNLHSSSNTYIMDMLVQSGSIHIFFSKKLPMSNIYNVYHVNKSINEQNPYIEYSWRKNNLSEIHSQNIDSSYSLLPSKGGLIHFASVWYDGTHYYINYHCYDDSTKSWLQKNLNISYKNQVFIKLLQHSKKISLLCFSKEPGADNIHHFISESSEPGEVDFKEHNNSYVDTNGMIPLFYSDDKALQLAWIKDNIFHQFIFDDLSGKWNRAIDLPVTKETNIQIIRSIRNPVSLSITKGYFILDNNYNLCRPFEHTPGNTPELKSREKQQTFVSSDINDNLKQIFYQIRDLTDNVRYLHNRIDNLESITFVQNAEEEQQKEQPFTRAKTASTDAIKPSSLKKSGFKENFLKSSTPSYDRLLVNHDSIITYVGNSGAGADADENLTENKPNDDAASDMEQMRSPSDLGALQAAGEDNGPDADISDK